MARSRVVDVTKSRTVSSAATKVSVGASLVPDVEMRSSAAIDVEATKAASV